MMSTESQADWIVSVGRRTIALGIISLLVAAFYLAVNLAVAGWDPAGLIQFGEDEPERSGYAFDRFGREIPLAGDLGHDGRFFFILASDPLFTNPHVHADQLDRPVYRAQRMLYPSIASVGGLVGPDGIAVAMIALQAVGLVGGTIVTGWLARALGLSEWWGLAFTFNPGVRYELEILGAGVMATALLVLAVYLFQTERLLGAVLAATLAVLTREVMWLGIAGVAAVAFKSRQREAVALALVPAGAAAVWAGYVRLRLGSLDSGAAVQELGVPFKGLISAVGDWLNGDAGSDVMVAVLVLTLVIAVLAAAVRGRSLVLWASVGFALIAPFLTEQVWINGFDISRAISPIFTFFLLVLAMRIRRVPAASGIER